MEQKNAALAAALGTTNATPTPARGNRWGDGGCAQPESDLRAWARLDQRQRGILYRGSTGERWDR